MDTLSELPSAPPGVKAVGKAVSMLDNGMVEITTGNIAVQYANGQTQLGAAGLDYVDDPVRLSWSQSWPASGNKDAVIKAARLIRTQGSAAVTADQRPTPETASLVVGGELDEDGPRTRPRARRAGFTWSFGLATPTGVGVTIPGGVAGCLPCHGPSRLSTTRAGSARRP
ncbi:hypothetical protein GCM10009681_53490 [Luedemannella helvata]|uniref:Uncharacterized protein n=1 Tax=Luedemannella helvata TaxID=349315 RepID=A0ABP4XAF0_9ACTN